MTFAEASIGIQGGQLAWRKSWNKKNTISKAANGTFVQSDGTAYNVPNADRDAADWQTGDKPREPKKVKEPVNTEYHAGRDVDPSKV